MQTSMKQQYSKYEHLHNNKSTVEHSTGVGKRWYQERLNRKGALSLQDLDILESDVDHERQVWGTNRSKDSSRRCGAMFAHVPVSGRASVILECGHVCTHTVSECVCT